MKISPIHSSMKLSTPYLVLLGVILLQADFIQAQEAKFSFNHVAVCVTDLERSANFYKNVLAFAEITNRSKLEGVRWFEMGQGKEIHLIYFVK